MNRLRKRARLCAEHQPQQVRMWKRFELFRPALGVRERCGWSFGHRRGPKPRFMESFNLQEWTRIGAMNLGKAKRTREQRAADVSPAERSPFCRQDAGSTLRSMESGASVLSEEYPMSWFPGDDLLAATRPRGLPIRDLTSQFWANCYLNPFDHFVQRELRCPGYVRYVDDFVLFADDKRLLWEWKRAVAERLARLRLTVHPGVHPRPVSEGIPFLGFIVYPHRRRLKRRKGIHFARKLRALVEACEAGEVPLSALTARVRAWIAHASHGNTVGLRKAILGNIRLKPSRPGPG